MDNKYDCIVIGGGAGGLFAASVANALGAKTAIVEKVRLGGDCTWFGCMPSKALLKSAQIASYFKRSHEYGFIERGLPDSGNVMRHVRQVVAEIATHHEPEAFENRGIKIIIGAPKFISNNEIEVNGENLSAKKFILCTGSHPVVLPIEGLDKIEYLTNENIFDLEVLPKSLIVLGGGPIGVELSQALCRLGVKVSIVEMMDRVLFREDKELSEFLEKKLVSEGINLLTGKKAVKFEEVDGEVIATLEGKDNKEEVRAQKVLVAIGRAPNLQGLDLEKANIKYNKKGIVLDKYLKTTNPNVFACGDIASPYQFSHVAAYQAGIAVRNALFRKVAWSSVNYDNVCWSTFTDPELAHLGLTESQAREKYSHIKVYTNTYTSSDRAVTDMEKQGMVKIIVDKKERILGAHIVGAQASEIIQGLLIAKSNKYPGIS